MRTITVDVRDDLADRLAEAHESLPELLVLSLQPPAQLYHTLLTLLASAPTSAQIASFAPSPVVQHPQQFLLERSHARALTATERTELDELARLEHLMVMLETGERAVGGCPHGQATAVRRARNLFDGRMVLPTVERRRMS